MSPSFKTLAILALAAVSVVAESHSVRYENRCGYGTPTLTFQNGGIIQGEYTSNGPLFRATAYLQAGYCGPRGEGCAAVIMDLTNPDSNASISLAPPHAFSVPTGFRYSLCGRTGADCNAPNCADASREVACNEDDVSIIVTFC